MISMKPDGGRFKITGQEENERTLRLYSLCLHEPAALADNVDGGESWTTREDSVLRIAYDIVPGTSSVVGRLISLRLP